MNKVFIAFLFLLRTPIFSCYHEIEMQDLSHKKFNEEQLPTYQDLYPEDQEQPISEKSEKKLGPDELFEEYDRLMKEYQNHYDDPKSIFYYRDPALKFFDLAYKLGSQRAILICVKNVCQGCEPYDKKLLTHVEQHIKDPNHAAYQLLRRHKLIS